MKKARVLFVSQEIVPYVKDTLMGTIGRYLPQGIQERGKEIRTFMPRFGNINERRHQLHEVIRLSGMNIIIDDNDHPLLIKVASIQAARMQVYFIDNEDYFQRKFQFRDKNKKFFEDNDERAIFFARGVLETVIKLGWAPDIVHCHGWFSSVIPLYLKTYYKEHPIFNETRVVCSIYDDAFEEPLSKNFAKKLKMEGVVDKNLKHYKVSSYQGMVKGAIDHSDAIIAGSEKIDPELASFVKTTKKPYLEFQSPDNYMDAYSVFYDKILEEVTVHSK